MGRLKKISTTVLAGFVLLVLANPATAQQQFGPVVKDVNKRMVKLFGSGGFRGVASYGTGVVISQDGYILTGASAMLDTFNLRVHTYDGRRFENVKVLVIEPELDLALLKIADVKDLPFFDIAATAKQPLAKPGDWILAFSNQFQIATRDEPMTVQRGAIAAYSKLQGRRGVNRAPYQGDVFVLDAITNNPGAAGGALTDRKGRLLGIIGKELRNTLSDTWINYAIPIQAVVEVQDGDKKIKLSVADFVAKGIAGEYKPVVRTVTPGGPQGRHGIVLVPDVIDRTPPFVDEVGRGSAAAKAGVRPDDLIVYIDGEQVVSIKHFNEIMKKMPPGADVTFEVRRGDKLQTIKLKLEKSKN